jgi:basic amino acid/polyamine antiporter, APA family
VQAFTFLTVVVTAANLPLYLVCSLAVIMLTRRGQMARIGMREKMLFAAAVLGAAYCVWAFLGVGWQSLAWALALCGAGLPVYLVSWYRQRRAGVVQTGVV